MTKQDIINFVFSSGTYPEVDPVTMQATGKTISWSLEEQVANSLNNNLNINKNASGYEIAEVDMSSGVITYKYSDTLTPSTDNHIIIMYIDCSNPSTNLSYVSNLETTMSNF